MQSSDHVCQVVLPARSEIGSASLFTRGVSFLSCPPTRLPACLVPQVSPIAPLKETAEEVQASRNKMNEDRNPQVSGLYRSIANRCAAPPSAVFPPGLM